MTENNLKNETKKDCLLFKIKTLDLKPIKKRFKYAWAIKMLFLTLVLSLSVSVFSEYVLTDANLFLALILLIPILFIAITTDMVGVAVTAASKELFYDLEKKNIKGAKEGLFLIKNAEKVSSICGDVIGDVCSIISGAIGVSISLKIIFANSTSAESILIASSVSALIAGVTVFGKAIGKKYAIDSCKNLILFIGKILSVFTKKLR